MKYPISPNQLKKLKISPTIRLIDKNVNRSRSMGMDTLDSIDTKLN